MARLDIAGEDLACFCEQFVGHPWDFNEWDPNRPPGRQWRSMPERVGLRVEHLLDHLEGRRTFGTNARWDRARRRHWTTWFAIDLDAQDLVRRADGTTSVGSPIVRYDQLRRLLGAPSFLFLTPSRGYHAYYFLEQPVELYALRHDDGSRGLLLELLEHAGLSERGGYVEVYPRGKTLRYRKQNPLRLPFGRGCRLLDPMELTPLLGVDASPVETLRFVRDRFDTGDVRRVALPHLARLHARAVPGPTTAGRVTLSPGPTPQRRASRLTEAHPDAARWLDAGLDGPGEFHAAVRAIARHLWTEYRSHDAAREELLTWLASGRAAASRTVQQDPAAARVEIEELVAYVYRSGRRAGHVRTAAPTLSRYEAERLVTATRGRAAFFDSIDGRELEPFKVQLFAFNVLRDAKHYLLEHASTALAGLGTTREQLLRVRRWWPDPTQPEFVVPSPFSRRRRYAGIGVELVAPLTRVLGALGIFCEAQAGRKGVSCSMFRVPLDFGACSTSRVTYASLEAILHDLLPPSELAPPYYTRHYIGRVRKVARASTVSLGAEQASPFIALVGAQLGDVAVSSASASSRSTAA